MSRDDDGLIDRALNAYVTKVPGRVVAATALIAYPVLGLFVPLLAGIRPDWFVSINLFGVAIAAAVSLAWLFAQLERTRRRQLLEWTTNLRLLSAEEFEWFVGEVFRREGWSVRERGSQSGPDGNIDLELTKGADRRFVQCKRWEARHVPVDAVRSFAGALLREGTDGAHGYFVTLSSFNDHAVAEARRIGLKLIDGRDLYTRADAVRRPEPCPQCAMPMRLAKSSYGWWFRCEAPGCAGKRDLGREAALAVDLLTQQSAVGSGIAND